MLSFFLSHGQEDSCINVDEAPGVKQAALYNVFFCKVYSVTFTPQSRG